MLRKLLVLALGLVVGGLALAAAQSADAAVAHHKSTHRTHRAKSRSHARSHTAHRSHSSRHTAHATHASRSAKATHRA